MAIALSAGADSSGELAYSLYSPLFLGSGASAVRMDSPAAAAINPAAAGNFQRTILDLSYINLANWDVSGMGHAANAGLSWPTRYGVLTGAFHFLTTEDLKAESMNFGTSGAMDLAFSKEIYKNLFTGISISSAYGTDNDWGIGLNLGFIHKMKSLWKLQNFRWGASLNRLGKSYGSKLSETYFNSVPNNITLQAGMAFDIIYKDDFVWSMSADAGFPTFSDLKLEIGQELRIMKNLRIALSSSMILSETINGNFQTLIPSVGIFYNLALSGKNEKKSRLQSSELEIQAAGGPLYNSTSAIGLGVTLPLGVRDTEPPRITTEYRNPIYISPDLNGVQDELNLPYTVEDERYVMGYRFKIYDDKGNLVKEFRNKEERPENESFNNLFQRLISPKSGTPLPATLRWDGIKDDGQLAKDGNYEFEMAFWDDNENKAVTERMPVVLDTKAPEISLVKTEGIDLIFSPDGDGNKDCFLLKQKGSKEKLWKAFIENQAGEVVKSFEWKEGNPENLEWDGRGDEGNIVPDGIYHYTIVAVDEAGNESRENLNNILINTAKPDIGLAINSAWLSPGNPDARDRVIFTPEVPLTAGIQEWKLEIQDLEGRSFWSVHNEQEGMANIPENLPYKGQAGANGTLAEGPYQAVLTMRYQNGYEPRVKSPVFRVDKTAPAGTVAGGEVFSPDGDGQKDSLNLKLDTSEEDYWEAFIRNEEGETVKSWFWRGKAEPELFWDGRDQDGRPVPDGAYRFILEAADKAGNRGGALPHRFTLDTRKTGVQLVAGSKSFSPDGNGVNDQMSLYSRVEYPEDVESWSLDILKEENNKVVYSQSGKGQVPENLSWNGQGKDGKVTDGNYKARLSLVYTKGDRPNATSLPFTRDVVPPVLTVEGTPLLFSPDGDGLTDVMTIHQTTSKEADLKAVIQNEAGKVVRSWFWTGGLEDIQWDGKDDNGNPVDDGTYSYILKASDQAGNSSQKALKNIQIDTRETPLYITAQNNIFSPLSGEFSSQIFKIHLGNPTGISSWRLSVLDKSGTSLRDFSGTDKVPSLLTWDGRDNAGELAEGLLKAELLVTYAKGNQPKAVTREFIEDNSPPLLELDLTPIPFSPDDDNVEDELKIAMNVKDLSPIREWNMSIKGPKGRDFITFGGKGRPSERIIWDGRSRHGELVQSAEDYPYEITITDYLGNRTMKKGNIPVDILVLREGNRLKVRISNITFQPYKSDLVDTGEQGIKNQEILNRLVQVLKKYGSYNIRIEGHAVSEYFDNPSRAAREEKEELQPLSLARASSVLSWLKNHGIHASRMEAAGKGGTAPVVPHSDLDNRWKNRRVEFLLIK